MQNTYEMTNTFTILGKKISRYTKPYIIAEACINHEGKISLAKKMVDEAVRAGVSAIKFQFHVLDDEMLKQTPKSSNFTETLFDTLNRTNLSINQHKYLKSYCEKKKIDYLCTPFSFKSADILEKEIKLKIFKVGSGELTNIPLQLHIAKKKMPTIISTGMSTMKEVEETFNLVKKINKNIALTQCTSSYPCDPRISDLKIINQYEKKFKVVAGLSDHTSTIYTSIGAVAMGARIIEKHFTLNKKAKGPDHTSSLEPKELKELVDGCNAVFYATRNEKKVIHKQEREIISWARESVVTINNIKKDDNFTKKNISVKRPAPKSNEIPAKYFFQILGKKSKVSIKINEKLKWQQIK
jgi:N,N'-diacetyllegionaminate synthase